MTLEAAKTIPPQDWMISQESRQLLAALETGEKQDHPVALFVGGCVRNALLNLPVEDVDLATRLKPEKVIEKLEKAGITVIPTGLQHGTVTAVINKLHFEITTLRHDVETDGRHAVVTFTENWLEDAKRRDFTMNTLLADSNGKIYDPTGQGLDDLDARRIRFVGEARKRIEEDYLRILRFFRFHAIYGLGDFDPDALKACRASADKIGTLSRERITQEVFKIMASDKPYRILEIMFKNNILKEFSHLEYQPDFFEHFCNFQKRYGLISLPARLFVQAGLKEGNIKAMEKLLLFPKVFLKDMQALSGALNLPDLSCDPAVRVCIYRFGRVIAAQALMVELAQDRVMNAYAPKALDLIQNWEVPDFPVTGNDLIKAGIPQGPELGEKMQKLEDWWIEDGFAADKETCLKNL
ncbi:MAG: CCA tRNA nucleotidyltransferase [Alphaproteobacteria bacterium]|nr:CCA tRNA nucleotidyltransferase [Alphaproteobacteria bacterium]